MEETNYHEKVDPYSEVPLQRFRLFGMIGDIWSLYGWWILASSILVLWISSKLQPLYSRWKQGKSSGRHHKNEDEMLESERALQAARAKQQEALIKAAQQYNLKKEQQELNKKTTNNGESSGNKLGRASDYFPLCGTGPSSNYKPPKKSKCSGGGCGK